jgi:protein-export membrane protein SecD
MNRNIVLLILIFILALVAVYIDLPNSPGIHIALGPIKADSDFKVRQGLDLRGGVQVLLVADVPTETVEAEAMQQVATIVENRVNALGLTEPVVQLQGSRRIIVELPGVEDPEAAIATIRGTGLLEFIDAGYEFLPADTQVKTTYPLLWSEGATTHVVSATVPVTPTGSLTPTVPITPGATSVLTSTVPTGTQTVYATVMGGSQLKGARVTTNTKTGKIGIAFELNADGTTWFKDFTTAHADNDQQPFYYMSIVLDRKVISSPHIVTPITEGSGEISGSFKLQEARNLAIQLNYGALPIPLKVESIRAVGPTLGQESVQRSIRAGVVGLSIVLLFMLLYYRLPGFLADLALILYGLVNFALYKAIPITLTLPAITGFILSTGMAVDANILVFERMKEELRAGRKLGPAIEAGFSRAWTSIRDSNISTLITCVILFYFGSTFGAGSVKGFAVTLALGVIINIFTAILVTRTFIRLVFGWLGDKLQTNRFLMGT